MKGSGKISLEAYGNNAYNNCWMFREKWIAGAASDLKKSKEVMWMRMTKLLDFYTFSL